MKANNGEVHHSQMLVYDHALMNIYERSFMNEGGCGVAPFYEHPFMNKDTNEPA